MVKKIFQFPFLIIGCLCFFSFSVTATVTKPHASIFQEVERSIEAGKLTLAENQLKVIEKNGFNNSKQNYECTKLLEKIYLTQHNFNKYSVKTDQLVKYAQKLHPIYLAEAYAYKAYYWHYMMWQDSALIYANKSFQLAQQNRSYFAKIEPAFIYEIYAITYLYRRTNLKTDKYQIEGLNEYQPIQFQYFDSAIYFQEKFPLKFSSDRAMLYRSYGNRWLDIVSSYRVCSDEELKKLKPIQWLAFKRADQLYSKGLAVLKKWHINDFFTLTALKGLNLTNVRKLRESNSICENALKNYSKEELLDRSLLAYQPLMNFMTYKIRSEILLPYHKPKVDFDLMLLAHLKEDFWHNFFDQCDLPYDPYRTSPYVNLFTLYRFKSLNETNANKSLAKGVSYLLTMKSYFHFLKHLKSYSRNALPYFDVSHIQQKLGKDECFLFMQNNADYLADCKILITQNQIQIVRSKFRAQLNNVSLDTLSVSAFKKLSFRDYRENFKDVLERFPRVKKVYVNYDDVVPYEILIKDTMQKNYSALPYLGLRINFVRIYDPISYFSDSLQIPFHQFDARFLVQKKGSKLLFMNDFFKHFNSYFTFTNNQYTGNFKKLLRDPGILHLYGHGELALNKESNSQSFQFSYLNSGDFRTENQLTGEFLVRRDLVVLNNCFSGYQYFNLNEFNKTIPLRILSNGAKAVIASPSKVDDFSSAEFFTFFYQNIEKGMLYEDAFFEAKKTFFKSHPELRQPHFWNAFQLFESYKLKNKQQTLNKYYYLQYLLILGTLDMLVILFYFLPRRFLPTHPLQE